MKRREDLCIKKKEVHSIFRVQQENNDMLREEILGGSSARMVQGRIETNTDCHFASGRQLAAQLLWKQLTALQVQYNDVAEIIKATEEATQVGG